MVMTKIYPRIWESVDVSGTQRLKVFGGWLVCTTNKVEEEKEQ